MKKFFSLIMVLSLVLCLATAVSAEEYQPQTYYTGSVTTEGLNMGLELPFTAPGDGVVTITVSNAVPGYDVGEATASDWRTGGESGTATFTVTSGTDYYFQFYGHDGTSDCSATYDVVVTYTGAGTISEYTPPVPGESMDNPIMFYMPTGTVTVPAGGTIYCMYTPMGMGGSPMGLTVTGTTGFAVTSFPAMGMPISVNDVEGVATLNAQYNNYKWGYVFAIQNNTESEQEYTVALAQKPGTSGNPDEMIIGVNTATMPGTWDGYYYLWTAEMDGNLTITMPENNWTYMIMVNGEMTTDNQLYSDDEVVVASQTLEVAAYDQVIVWVNSYDPSNMFDMNPSVELSFTAEFEVRLGTENNPISVNVPGDLTSANVAAGAEVWYAVSSRLDGYTLTVEGEGAYVIVNGTRVDAVDGVVTVNLAAEGAVIPVVIGNAGEEDAEFDCQIKYPPVEINAAGSYEAQVAAGAEVAYLVNSRLDGYVLTVEGEDAYVIVNGEKVEAVDGVVTVTLEAKGATIPVFVGNAGDAAATYTVVISAADTSPETGDMIAAALVLMLTSGAAVVCLKKKEN